MTVTASTPLEYWRYANFGTLENAGNAADLADPDGDGDTNRFEYVAGLSPLDPASRFDARVDAVAGQPGRKAILFSPIVAGRSYVVTSTANLTSPTWTALTSFTTFDDGTEQTVIDLDAGTESKFYRVEIVLP